MAIKQHVLSALVSALVSVCVCLGFSVVRRHLYVEWQFDEARRQIALEKIEDARFQAYADNFWKTNVPSHYADDGSPLYFSMPFRTFRSIQWHLPIFDEQSRELGWRLDGTVVFRTPPEAPRPKLTNDLPIL